MPYRPECGDNPRRLWRLARAGRSHKLVAGAPARRLERLAPLLRDRLRLLLRQRRGRRKPVEPGKRPTGVDDRLGMRCDPALLVVRRDARIQRRAPGLAYDIDLLGRLATRRNGP